MNRSWGEPQHYIYNDNFLAELLLIAGTQGHNCPTPKTDLIWLYFMQSIHPGPHAVAANPLEPIHQLVYDFKLLTESKYFLC